MSAEMEPIAAQAAPRKRGGRKLDKAQAVRNADLQNAGRILPNCPTTAEDLVEQWQIPGDDAYSVRVAVMKQERGEEGPKLMASVPVLDYDMGQIAGKYGPGLYFIKGQPHKWAVHSARFEVSEEYARAHGFGRVPARAQDLLAARTLQEATKGPSDPVDLMASIETLIDRKFSEMNGNHGDGFHSVNQNPMVSMEKQAESMFGMLSVIDKMETRLMAMAERKAGLRSEGEPVPPASTTLEIIKALAPALNPLIQRIFDPTPIQPRPALPAAQAAVPAPRPNVTGEAVNLPELTDQEKAKLAPSVRALKPYAAMLATIPVDASKTDHELADGLGSYIPPAMYPAIMDLAELVTLKGPAVLGYIDPGLPHPRWPAILAELRAMLKQALEGGE